MATPEELQLTGQELATTAEVLRVTDQPTFRQAGTLLLAVKDYRAKVGEILDPIIKSAHDTHKKAVEQKKRLEEPAIRAEQALKGALATYEQEQARLRREAEIKAEAERMRLVAEIRQKNAFLTEGAGVAASFAPEPVVAVRPPMPEAPKTEGVSFRTQYRAEVVDLKALVQAVAAGNAPLTMLQPDQAALNQMARAMKQGMNLPGVRVIEERIVAART